MKNSPRAFPQTHPENALIYLDRGMTLRDYFAAKAMQAFYSRPDSDEWEPHEVAEDAYVIADAMLKARDA